MAFFISLITACGGGGSGFMSEAPLIADAVIKQVPTSVLVTPGEEFRMTLLNVTCPLYQRESENCAKPVLIGELVFESTINVINTKILYNGRELSGYFSRENDLYRFIPHGPTYLWQQGSLEIIGMLNPNTKNGGTTQVHVSVVSASFDTHIELKPAMARIDVFVLSQYAPVMISTILPPFTYGEYPGEMKGFMYVECPITVIAGCVLDSFDIQMHRLVPGTDVRLYIDGNLWTQAIAYQDKNGYFGFSMRPSYLILQGGKVTISVSATFATAELGSTLMFNDIVTLSGGKKILPIRPSECTPVSMDRCKG